MERRPGSSAAPEDAEIPPRSDEPPLLVVGRVGRAHGLGGEVGVALVGDDPARLAAGRELHYQSSHRSGRAHRSDESPRLLRVVTSRGQGRRLLLRFEGVETREGAEGLTGGYLSVRFDPADLGGGEYFAHQLEGLRVLTREGEEAGRVVGVVFAPGRQFLEVSGGGRERPFLVPFHADIVKEVDLAAGRLTIDPPEGLLEL